MQTRYYGQLHVIIMTSMNIIIIVHDQIKEISLMIRERDINKFTNMHIWSKTLHTLIAQLPTWLYDLIEEINRVLSERDTRKLNKSIQIRRDYRLLHFFCSSPETYK